MIWLSQRASILERKDSISCVMPWWIKCPRRSWRSRAFSLRVIKNFRCSKTKSTNWKNSTICRSEGWAWWIRAKVRIRECRGFFSWTIPERSPFTNTDRSLFWRRLKFSLNWPKKTITKTFESYKLVNTKAFIRLTLPSFEWRRLTGYSRNQIEYLHFETNFIPTHKHPRDHPNISSFKRDSHPVDEQSSRSRNPQEENDLQKSESGHLFSSVPIQEVADIKRFFPKKLCFGLPYTVNNLTSIYSINYLDHIKRLNLSQLVRWSECLSANTFFSKYNTHGTIPWLNGKIEAGRSSDSELHWVP